MLMNAAGMIRYGYYSDNANEARAALRRLADKAKSPDIKSAAIYNVAMSMIEQGGTDSDKLAPEARTLLQQVRRDYPGTQYGKMAGAALFAAEKLQIGMAAPDFNATDEKGQTFKLSDYKGKVVVLDFWGF